MGALQQAPDGDFTVTAAAMVLNRYGRLGVAASRGAKQLTLSSAVDFAGLSVQPGDLLLVMQPQGAQLQTADSDQYGGVSALNSAGLFEFVAVAAVDGTTNRIMLDGTCGGLRNSYDPLGAAQVIRVPQYGSLTVNAGASVVALPWNGQVGGVVAVRAQSSLTVNGEIAATGQGFRGGPALPSPTPAAPAAPGSAARARHARARTPAAGPCCGVSADSCSGAPPCDLRMAAELVRCGRADATVAPACRGYLTPGGRGRPLTLIKPRPGTQETDP